MGKVHSTCDSRSADPQMISSFDDNSNALRTVVAVESFLDILCADGSKAQVGFRTGMEIFLHGEVKEERASMKRDNVFVRMAAEGASLDNDEKIEP
ncbi:hypothetical protein SADUNF_Sadunf14G0013200 [Salix dunnii]|uniref:Uncharacterized protein n=1 Tax=Salix dunnii TaxID=1413687 RepID=A0A835JFN0_9ROSI|nr:hypothetical protein SADUNF_Sadunf14G0013200 [Salix dunnii]